jgi:site-specific DNA-methyltransferase (adenine-specific)
MPPLFIMLYNDDCLNILPSIEDESIDLIVCDPPYGITKHDWDIPISMWFLFNQLRRIIKPKGSILMFGVEPFSSNTRMFGSDLYKYDWLWVKSRKHGYHHAQSQPLQETENISVFSKASVQSTSKNNIIFNPNKHTIKKRTGAKLKQKTEERYDTNLLRFGNTKLNDLLHPSQKPIDLIEYLILRHSNEGAVVLDPCFGSGTTLVAANNTNRSFIGIEKNKNFFEIGKTRINEC